MAGILVFAERDELAFDLLPRGAEIARGLNLELNAAVLGQNTASRASRYFDSGVLKVFSGENEHLNKFDSQVFAEALFQVIQSSQPEVVLLASTKSGREIASRLAQMLDAGCLTNVLDIAVEGGKLVASRYGLGGATIISESLESPRKVIALLPQKSEAAPVKQNGQIINVELKLNKPVVEIIERTERRREAVDIEKADVLVCVGRGLKRKEDLAIVQEFANVVHGEICCTRELSSNLGWLTEDRLVGISGKRCKPKIVFSIGISGQSQYIAGIIGAKIVVAINNDSNAPIFKLADYGMVDDLYRVLPELAKKLKEYKRA